MTQPVIQVKDLSKCYQIRSTTPKPYHSLREDLVDGFKGLLRGEWGQSQSEDFWALKDVSFDVNQGDRIGIIGRNGAGKSTLLKILSRIVRPTSGEVMIRGRVGSLLEVGTGFHPELTGRENIFMNGAILGMKRAEIVRKFDEIVDFAEVEKFLDTPVKFYSSGMYVRLAFAVAAHLEPEILIVDEVLAVGDAAFQKKCLGKMGDVAEKEGRTVLFVSHNMAAIKSLCNQAILISDGYIVKTGKAYELADVYLSNSQGEKITSIQFKKDAKFNIQFLYASLIEDINKNDQEIVVFNCEYIVTKELINTLLCVELQNVSGEIIFYCNDSFISDIQKRSIGKHHCTLTIPKYLLTSGDYYLAFGFWEPGHPPEHFPKDRLFFHVKDRVSCLSKHGIKWPGLIYIPNNWEYKKINTLNC